MQVGIILYLLDVKGYLLDVIGYLLDVLLMAVRRGGFLAKYGMDVSRCGCGVEKIGTRPVEVR